MNAIEATDTAVDGPRQIVISTLLQSEDQIVKAISDSGSGLPSGTDTDQLF
jgi:signal transduction histidine kinase